MRVAKQLEENSSTHPSSRHARRPSMSAVKVRTNEIAASPNRVADRRLPILHGVCQWFGVGSVGGRFNVGLRAKGRTATCATNELQCAALLFYNATCFTVA